jgi:hypothetical protein
MDAQAWCGRWILTVIDNVGIGIASLLLHEEEGFFLDEAILGNATILLFPYFSMENG